MEAERNEERLTAEIHTGRQQKQRLAAETNKLTATKTEASCRSKLTAITNRSWMQEKQAQSCMLKQNNSRNNNSNNIQNMPNPTQDRKMISKNSPVARV